MISTAFLPPAAYLAHILHRPGIKIGTGERWEKQTHRNRTWILTANGPQMLVIPVNSAAKTAEITIAEETWKKTAWKSIISAYKNSPYFEEIGPDFEMIFLKREKYLVDFNHITLDYLNKRLRLELVFTLREEDLDEKNSHDWYAKTTQKAYFQVFSYKLPFTSGMGLLDLAFNLGPETGKYLAGIF